MWGGGGGGGEGGGGLQSGTGVWKISSAACGFSPIKIHFSDYPKSLTSSISEVYVFFIKYRYSNIF